MSDDYNIGPVVPGLMRAHEERYLEARKELTTLHIENVRLKAFRDAVVGWRENDWPEWFCRRTAEAVADLGRAAIEGREK